MELTVTVHTDPGHGWAEVKKSLVESLGIADKITIFSYVKNGVVYLEVDCDLETFRRTAESAGYHITFKERHTNMDHPIRNYPCYRQEAVADIKIGSVKELLEAYRRLWAAVENGTLKDDFFSLRGDFRGMMGKYDTGERR